MGRSGTIRVGPGRVERLSGRSDMNRGTLRKVQDGWGTPRGGPGRVRGPSRRSGKGCSTLGEVRDGSGYPQGGPVRVGEHSRIFGTGRGTLVEARNGLGDLLGGLGQVVGLSGMSETSRWTLGGPGRVGGPSLKSGRVGDPQGFFRHFRGLSERSGRGRGTQRDFLDESGDPWGGPGRVG